MFDLKMKPVISIGKLAARLHYTPTHIGRLADAGKIPSMIPRNKTRHRRFILTARLQSYIAKREESVWARGAFKRTVAARAKLRRKVALPRKLRQWTSPPSASLFLVLDRALVYAKRMLQKEDVGAWSADYRQSMVDALVPLVELSDELKRLQNSEQHGR